MTADLHLFSHSRSDWGLEVNNVTFSWPCGRKALDNCTFKLPVAGLWMLVGANGSGKSTLLRLIRGVIEPKIGIINSNLKSSLMFQNPDHQILLPSCESDILLGLPPGLTQKQRSSRVREVLSQVGLKGMESRPIHTLSGGQKQRLALAGALAADANLLLLDEPTALLDPISQEGVIRVVKGLCNCKEKPIAALWITHRLQELHHCNGAAFMQNGSVGPWMSGDLLIKDLNPLAVGRV